MNIFLPKLTESLGNDTPMVRGPPGKNCYSELMDSFQICLPISEKMAKNHLRSHQTLWFTCLLNFYRKKKKWSHFSVRTNLCFGSWRNKDMHYHDNIIRPFRAMLVRTHVDYKDEQIACRLRAGKQRNNKRSSPALFTWYKSTLVVAVRLNLDKGITCSSYILCRAIVPQGFQLV